MGFRRVVVDTPRQPTLVALVVIIPLIIGTTELWRSRANAGDEVPDLSSVGASGPDVLDDGHQSTDLVVGVVAGQVS